MHIPDRSATHALVTSAEEAERFLRLPSYDKAATALLMERVLSYLDGR